MTNSSRPKYARVTIYCLAGLAAAALTLIGCPGEPPPGGGNPMLSVSPQTVDVSADSAQVDIFVQNTGSGSLSWSAQTLSGGDFIEIIGDSSGVNSGAVTLLVDEHSSPGTRDAFDPREGVVRISSNAGTRDVTITQEGDTEEYFQGFDDGFAVYDEWVFGFDDSFLAVGFENFYEGDEIPFIDDLSYDAGYYDGIWTAYNDGYFTSYLYCFAIGFSEGYDTAFHPDYLTFLVNDQHTEFANGNFDDGYDDGFTEGRVFGAVGFESNLPFDWLDALLDWESGTDLYFEEIDVGTGEFGPAILYQYGEDPDSTQFVSEGAVGERDHSRAAVKSFAKYLATLPARRTQRTLEEEAADSAKQAIEFARPLTPEQEADLDVAPLTSLRSDRVLRLETTWLERIHEYNDAYSKARSGDESPRVITLRMR